MKTLAFSAYDAAAKLFLEPFYAETVEVACRMFREVVNREGHQFNKYPEDYTLFQVGEFDTENGVFKVMATPHSLGLAVQFLNGPRGESPKLVKEAN